MHKIGRRTRFPRTSSGWTGAVHARMRRCSALASETRLAIAIARELWPWGKGQRRFLGRICCAGRQVLPWEIGVCGEWRPNRRSFALIRRAFDSVKEFSCGLVQPLPSVFAKFIVKGRIIPAEAGVDRQRTEHIRIGCRQGREGTVSSAKLTMYSNATGDPNLPQLTGERSGEGLHGRRS